MSKGILEVLIPVFNIHGLLFETIVDDNVAKPHMNNNINNNNNSYDYVSLYDKYMCTYVYIYIYI